jgi:hypothetical protein
VDNRGVDRRPVAAELVAVAASLCGGFLPPERPIRFPAGGPQDVVIYTTLDLLLTADGGNVGSDGLVRVTNTADQRVTILDLAVIDRMKDLGWIEYPDHQTVQVTEKGRYWSEKFGKANRLRMGRLWGEWSTSR